MQYLLSAEEYAALKAGAQVERDELKADLQKLCTLVAIHMPVNRSWREADQKPEPWGCILGDGDGEQSGYCDECPVRKLCPYKGKRFSQ